MKNTTDTNSLRAGKHTATSRTIDKISATLSRRHKADRIFRMTGAAAVGTSLLFIALLFGSIFYNGYTAFFQTRINLEIFFDPAELTVTEGRVSGDFNSLVHKALDSEFGQPDSRDQRRKLYGMISQGAVYELGEMVERDPALIGTSKPVWLLADDDIDMLAKGHIDRSLPEDQRRIDNIQLEWVEQLESSGAVRTFFNSSFFLSADSREPEMAGILGALTGSLFTLFITLTLSVPIGVAAAIYLEEFAPKNRWTDLIEVNINNLAAVPSIVFGLLGLSIFLVFFWTSPLCPACRRHGTDTYDVADNNHFKPVCTEIGTSLDPRCSTVSRSIGYPDGFSSCSAPGRSGNHDRNNYRNGSGTG